MPDGLKLPVVGGSGGGVQHDQIRTGVISEEAMDYSGNMVPNPFVSTTTQGYQYLNIAVTDDEYEKINSRVSFPLSDGGIAAEGVLAAALSRFGVEVAEGDDADIEEIFAPDTEVKFRVRRDESTTYMKSGEKKQGFDFEGATLCPADTPDEDVPPLPVKENDSDSSSESTESDPDFDPDIVKETVDLLESKLGDDEKMVKAALAGKGNKHWNVYQHMLEEGTFSITDGVLTR